MRAFVSILLGSKSDQPVMIECVKVLEKFGVGYEMIVASAHRSPERVVRLVKNAEQEGAKVFICAAGMAAHLAGAVKAQTTKPVIGVPIASGALNGIDALYSTVQMPPKMAVAAMAIGGAINAAYLAIEILAISDEKLARKLLDDRENITAQVEADSLSVEISAKLGVC